MELVMPYLMVATSICVIAIFVSVFIPRHIVRRNDVEPVRNSITDATIMNYPINKLNLWGIGVIVLLYGSFAVAMVLLLVGGVVDWKKGNM